MKQQKHWWKGWANLLIVITHDYYALILEFYNKGGKQKQKNKVFSFL